MSFWDNLYAALYTCNIPDFDVDETIHDKYNKLYSNLFGAVYSSVTSLILCMTFYILMPRNKREFQKWYICDFYYVI